MSRPNVPAPMQPTESRILLICGQKVMIDADLAELYGVPTKALNQAVKRNAERFPADFMFQLTTNEKQEVVTNCDHLGKLKFSRTLPARESWFPINSVNRFPIKGGEDSPVRGHPLL